MKVHSLHSTGTINKKYHFPLRHFVVVFVIAIMAGSLFSARFYIHEALQNLQTVAPAAGEFHTELADAWWDDDKQHLETLAKRWPLSLPSLLSETTLMFFSQLHIEHSERIASERGYFILPAHTAGKSHMLSTAIKSRLETIVSPKARNVRQWHYVDHHIIDTSSPSFAVHVDEVQTILDDLAVPDHVLSGLRITLLPFPLLDTAGLGSAGNVMIGASPYSKETTHPKRTEYTILHEIGHHIHFAYIDRMAAGDMLWQQYMHLRNINDWTTVTTAADTAWQYSAQETFAEDFRMLFGPRSDETIPHMTAYGDPRQGTDNGLAVYEFINSILQS